jgi:hypothetical protein
MIIFISILFKTYLNKMYNIMSTRSMEEPVLKCPHCSQYIIIEKLNCGIFRHGILITNGQQINPHESKEMCDYFYHKKLIYGCGKPFQIIKHGEKFQIQICDYI